MSINAPEREPDSTPPPCVFVADVDGYHIIPVSPARREALARAMQQGQGGSIVNFSSIAAGVT